MPRKICVAPGCEDIALEGLSHCYEHDLARLAKLKQARVVAQSTAAAKANRKLYATPRWKRESKMFLNRNPLCIDCGELGVVEPATQVDHIKRHEGDAKLFWDRSNWQALCHRCHSRKTAGEVFHGR